MQKGVLFLLILVSCLSVRANNVQLQGTVKVIYATGSLVTMEVDLSWDNSWRDDYNWDAVWLFFKYKVGVDGVWEHAAINAAGAVVMEGDYSMMSGTTASTVPGLFVYPSKDRSGNTGSLKVQVQWAKNYTKTQFDNNDIFVVAHGVEMVYIPYGAYALGDGSSENSFCTTDGKPVTIDSETALTLSNSPILPSPSSSLRADYPKGYQGFYIMKYETSQEEYVEFLNTLTLVQQTALIPGVEALNVGDFVFGTNKKASNYRNSVILSGKMVGKPLFFDNNLNNNQVYSEDSDGGTLAMNYMSISDAQGYASWAGLRPITEMEYEKACRRPYPQEPEAGEYAWNSATGATATTAVSNSGKSTESVTSGNVNANGSFTGPIRCGAFARSGSTNQAASGATYWGVMEMSGNLSELCANITNTTISRTGNGTGTYNAGLFGIAATGYGTRGGGFLGIYTTLTTSDRTAASRFTSITQRDSTVGFRCAFTYNEKATIDAGTIIPFAGIDTVCPGTFLTISGTLASVDGFKVVSYIWTVNDTIQPNAVGANLTFKDFMAGRTYTFVRKAISSVGESSTSAIRVFVTLPKLVAGNILGGVCCDKGVMNIANYNSAFIECGYPISYKWIINDSVVSGEDVSLTYDFKALGNFNVRRRAFSNGDSIDTSTTIYVVDPAPYQGNIASGVTRPGDTFTVESIGLASVSCGKIVYSWFVNNELVPGDGSELNYTFTTTGRHTIIRRATADNGKFSNAVSYVAVGTCPSYVSDKGYSYSVKLMADGHCWMTQNLRRTDVAYVYAGKSASNAVIYGCQYTWKVATNGAIYEEKNLQGICPSGWHIPSHGEWANLIYYYGSAAFRGYLNLGGKAEFNLTLTGGDGYSVGNRGVYWTSSGTGREAHAYQFYSSGYFDYNREYSSTFSVRCVQNYD